MVQQEPINSVFHNYFRVTPADTEDLIKEVYKIRHQVYCEELEFEEQRKNHLEFDEHDLHSIHCLLYHTPSQSYAGCIRLILCKDADPTAAFPFEKICGDPYLGDFDELTDKPRTCHGEISRLAITSNFRRRRGEADQPDGNGTEGMDTSSNDERRHFPSVGLGLYLAITAMGLKLGLDGVFAMMEPRLARQLRRFGFFFTQVGETTEHRGMRAPFFISRKALFDNLKPEYVDLLNDMQASIQPDTLVKHAKTIHMR